jgi:hypothetical protein
MRTLGLSTLILAASLAGATTPLLPEGSFAGTATWRGPSGSTGTYAVERTFSGTTITSHYSWTEPQAREESVTLTFAMKPSEPGFEVLDSKNAVVGKGYCYDDACAYRATFGPVTVDETLRFSAGSIVAVGQKSGPGFSVVWKETLKSR